MTYSKVQDVLDGKEVAEYIDFVKDIKNMETLAKILNNKREKNGSINFDIPETKIYIANNGNVQKISPYVTTFANQIIEEFMLVANEVVAKTFFDLVIPFVYRVHEKPEREKMTSFVNFLSSLGLQFKAEKKDVEPRDLQAILNKVEEMPYKSGLSHLFH